PVALVHRIGKPDASLAVDRQIVGRIKFFAIEPVGDYRVFAVGIETYDGASARATAEQPSALVKRKTIGTIGTIAPVGNRSRPRVVAQDFAGLYVSKQNVLARPYRPFRQRLGGRLHQQFKFPRHVNSSLTLNYLDVHFQRIQAAAETIRGVHDITVI